MGSKQHYIVTKLMLRGRFGMCASRMQRPVSRGFDHEVRKSPRGETTRWVSNNAHRDEKAEERYRIIGSFRLEQRSMKVS